MSLVGSEAGSVEWRGGEEGSGEGRNKLASTFLGETETTLNVFWGPVVVKEVAAEVGYRVVTAAWVEGGLCPGPSAPTPSHQDMETV